MSGGCGGCASSSGGSLNPSPNPNPNPDPNSDPNPNPEPNPNPNPNQVRIQQRRQRLLKLPVLHSEGFVRMIDSVDDAAAGLSRSVRGYAA